MSTFASLALLAAPVALAVVLILDAIRKAGQP